MDYKFISYEKENNIAFITLNRPRVHNAFNDDFIEELTQVFNSFYHNTQVRLIALKAEGQSFCAGADLNWMASMMGYSQKENTEDAQKLEKLFFTINNCPIPTMAMVHGHVLGGGVGLISVCDYVLCSENVLMGFTEARLGLAPATIAPYVISKIGVSKARRWFVSGERFTASEALSMNLVHEVVSATSLEDTFNKRLASFLKAGPIAAKKCKELVLSFENQDKYRDMTCELIASLRVSPEGQEGMKALLEKRKPRWIK